MQSLQRKKWLLGAVVVAVPVAAVLVQAVVIEMTQVERNQLSQQLAQLQDRILARDAEELIPGMLEEIRVAALASAAADDLPPPGSYPDSAVVAIGVAEQGELRWSWELAADAAAADAVAADAAAADADAADADLAADVNRAAAVSSDPDIAAIEAEFEQILGYRPMPLQVMPTGFWLVIGFGWDRALLRLFEATDATVDQAFALVSARLDPPLPAGSAYPTRLRDAIRSLHDAPDGNVIFSSRGRIDSILAEAADLVRLQNDFSALAIADDGWQEVFGSEPWFVIKASAGRAASPLVIAVRATSLRSEARSRVLDQRAATGFGATPNLIRRGEITWSNGLVTLSQSPSIEPSFRSAAAADRRPWPSIFQVGMTLAIVLSILGAYVLWRETQRDNAMIEMQAQFVSGISHELKTPLTAIRMFAETLQIADETGAGDPARRAEYIDTIVHESERLTRLLNNVLTFAQIERGNSSFHRQRIDLKEVLREAAHMMRFSLEDKELTLQLDLPDQVPSVKADRDAIEQAVLNLLSNAIKYSGDGHEIGLKLRAEGDELVIAVSDSGIGISESEQQRIFESFYRAADSKSQAIGGTGLGLAIVSYIASAHGGSVTVDSEYGRGSVFTIRLPLAGAA